MKLILPLVILGGAAFLQAMVLHRRGQSGERIAVLVLTAISLTGYVIYDINPDLLLYPMHIMNLIFTPIGKWIVGR